VSAGAGGPPGAPGAWERLGSALVGDYGIFRVRRDRVRSPRTGAVFERHVLELPDWVNVVALAEDGRLVLVEQFRHGRRATTLELPAGIVEPGEDPCAAARRELEEETGYRAASCVLVGELEPNPALQTNRLFVALADGCVPGGEAAQDEGEDVRPVLVAPAQVPGLIAAGRIRHALAVAAWHLYELRGRG